MRAKIIVFSIITIIPIKLGAQEIIKIVYPDVLITNNKGYSGKSNDDVIVYGKKDNTERRTIMISKQVKLK